MRPTCPTFFRVFQSAVSAKYFLKYIFPRAREKRWGTGACGAEPTKSRVFGFLMVGRSLGQLGRKEEMTIFDGVIRGTMRYELPVREVPFNHDEHEARKAYARKQKAQTEIRKLKKFLCRSVRYCQCWECECIDCCGYGKTYLRLLEDQEDQAGRRWEGYQAAAKHTIEVLDVEEEEQRQKRLKCMRKYDEKRRGKKRAAGAKEREVNDLLHDQGT